MGGGPGPQRFSPRSVAGKGRVDNAAAAAGVRADDLEVGAAPVPAPRPAVGGGEDTARDPPVHRDALAEAPRPAGAPEDPEQVPQLRVAEAPAHVGVRIEAVEGGLVGPCGNVAEDLLDLQDTHQVEPVFAGAAATGPSLQSREEDKVVAWFQTPQCGGPGAGGAVVPVGERLELGVVVRRPVP